MRLFNIRISILLASSACAWSLPAMAQNGPAPSTATAPAAGTADDTGIQDIVVTANKRSELAQGVPISINVTTGVQLAQAGITEVANLPRIAPGVFIAPISSTTQTIVRIRGVGTSGNNNGFESAVGVFVDGVFRPRAGQALGNFVDVSRVEVLRGPQGTLFGKNTTAGAISIITNKPTFDLEGSALVGIGNFDYRRVEAMINVPLSDTLAVRFAGNLTDRAGVQAKLLPFTNTASPTRIDNYFNNRNRWIIKGQILFEPTDRFRLRVIGDYSRIDEIGNIGMPTIIPAGFNAVYAALGAYRQPDNTLSTRQTQVNSDHSEKTSDVGISAEAKYDFGFGTLTSISAWRNYKSDRRFDLDLQGYDVLGSYPEYQYIELKSQELQLGGTAGKLIWLVGAFAYDERIDFGSDIRLGPQFAQFAGVAPRVVPLGSFAGQGFNQAGFQTNRGYSIFTQESLNLTDRLQLTAGLRYNYSSKRGVSIHNGATPVPATTPGSFSVNDPFCAVVPIQSICFNRSIDVSRSESAWSGTAKIKYDFSPRVHAYASYSRGYKAGGINLDREAIDDTGGVVTDLSTFRPESVDSFEVGIKSQLLNDRLRVNVAAFVMDFSNFQLNSFNGVSFTIINVPAKSQGVEAEIVAEPIRGLTFNLSGAFNVAKFPNDLSGIPLASPFQGKDLPSSPHVQVNAGFNFDREIPGTGLRAQLNANVMVMSDYNAGSQGDPTQIADGYALAGGSIGLRTVNDRFGAKLSVTNAFDTIIPQFITATILQTGGRYAYLNDPRQLVFSIDAKF